MKIPESCEECKEIVKTRSRIVNGYGNENSKIMFIGICPGNHMLRGGADSTGIPFKGDMSGRIFERMLELNELHRDDVYTTNLVKCRPSDKSRMYNRPPTEEEISNCIKYVKEEIKHIKPKLVICLGKVVYKHVPEEIEGCKYIKVYHWHPGFLAREQHLLTPWVKNIKKDIIKWTSKLYLQSSVEDFEQKNCEACSCTEDKHYIKKESTGEHLYCKEHGFCF